MKTAHQDTPADDDEDQASDTLFGSGPYWGFDTFAAYYANWSSGQIGVRSKEHIWESMMKFVRQKGYESVIRFFERQEPSYRTSPVWYFVIPECREMIPPEMLAIADRCGAGVQNRKIKPH